MAHTKAAGAVGYGKDSRGQRLGVKKSDGQKVQIGNILIRQRGTKFLAGQNTAYGDDYTIYAMKDGMVKFTDKTKTSFDGSKRTVKMVSVLN